LILYSAKKKEKENEKKNLLFQLIYIYINGFFLFNIDLLFKSSICRKLFLLFYNGEFNNKFNHLYVNLLLVCLDCYFWDTNK